MRGPIVLTGTADTLPGLAELLRAQGLAVDERPLLQVGPPESWAPLDAALLRLHEGHYTAIALTSPRAAEAFRQRMQAGGMTWPMPVLRTVTIWAAGAGTANAVSDLGAEIRAPEPDEVGRLGAAAALARILVDAGVAGPVLFPCGDRHRDDLPRALRTHDITVDEVVCYRAVPASEDDAREVSAHAAVVVVTSPTVADLLARSCPADARPALLAIGPTTAAASEAAGWPAAAVATTPTVAAIAAAARSLLT